MSKVVYKVPTCFLHTEPYLFYCESCQQPICKKCTIIGPHNNELHLCNHIQESYKVKVAEIEELLNQSLPQKRQIVLSEVSRLELAIQETKAVKDDILKYTKQKSLGILNRLQKAEQNKTLYLKSLIQSLYKDSNQIYDLGNQFQKIIQESNTNRMVDLLASYGKIQTQLQRLSHKIYNEAINVSEEDLPQQLSEIRWKLQRKASYQEINKAKCGIIAKTLEKRMEEENRIEERVEREFKDDLKSWRKQTQYNLNNFHSNFLICHFCGCSMSETSINEECKINNHVPKDFKGFCQYPPSYEYYGTSRHYFQKRFDGSYLNTQDKVSAMYLKILIGQLRVEVLHSNLKLEKLIKQHDKKQAGEIKRLDFLYILSEKCKLDIKTAELIINSLPSSPTGIKYGMILQLVSKNNWEQEEPSTS